MAISRSKLLKELLPGLNELFRIEYEKYDDNNRLERNKQAHGAQTVDGRRLDVCYQAPPEGYTQRSSI